MSTYTPGNWVAVGTWVEHDDDGVADICSCNPETLGQKHLKRSYDEMCANAKLIAAAPDMLYALEDLLAVVAAHDRPKSADELGVIGRAMRAVSKVKGEG